MTRLTTPYEEVRERLLQDPATRKAYDNLETAYRLTCLRIEKRLTQEQLAELVGTKQPSIARLERGTSAPSLSFLKRVVEALDARLIITIEPNATHKS